MGYTQAVITAPGFKTLPVSFVIYKKKFELWKIRMNLVLQTFDHRVPRTKKQKNNILFKENSNSQINYIFDHIVFNISDSTVIFVYNSYVNFAEKNLSIRILSWTCNIFGCISYILNQNFDQNRNIFWRTSLSHIYQFKIWCRFLYALWKQILKIYIYYTSTVIQISFLSMFCSSM